jgi:hypothetical protein
MHLDTNATLNEMNKLVVKDSEGNYFHCLGLILETRGALLLLNGSPLECKLGTLLSARTLPTSV